MRRTAEHTAILLSNRRQKMASVLKHHKFPPPHHPTTIQLDYARVLLKIVDTARKKMMPHLSGLFKHRQDAIDPKISKVIKGLTLKVPQEDAEDWASTYGERVSNFQKQDFSRQMKSALGTDVLITDKGLTGKLDEFVSNNVDLIQNIPEELSDQLDSLISNAIADGALWEDIADDIEERFGIAENRAKLIARDQVGKLYGQVNALRQQNLGITQFRWKTVNDNRVREEHTELQQQSETEPFSYDDPPEEGLPGEPIDCRCYAEPVLDDLLNEDNENNSDDQEEEENDSD